MKLFLFASLLTFCSASEAYAYIDPGSGSMLIQGLVGVLAGVLVFWRQFRTWVQHKLARTKEKQKPTQD